MELCGVHIVLIVQHRSPCLLNDLLIGSAHGHNAVKILLCIVEYGSHHAVEHIGEEEALLCDGIVLVLLGKRVQGLGLEGYAPLPQAQPQPVHTQLLRGVEVQKFCRHGRLYTAAGGCLFVKEQYVVVGNRHGHGQMALCVTGRQLLQLVPLHGHPHGRLCHTVEIYVVLAYELIHLGIVIAPVSLPFVLIRTL